MLWYLSRDHRHIKWLVNMNWLVSPKIFWFVIKCEDNKILIRNGISSNDMLLARKILFKIIAAMILRGFYLVFNMGSGIIPKAQ